MLAGCHGPTEICFSGSLTDHHEVQVVVSGGGDARGRKEDVVGLLRSEVRDDAHHDAIEAELGSNRCTLGQFRADLGDGDAVAQRPGGALGPGRHRRTHIVGHGDRGVVETNGAAVREPGERVMARPAVVLGGDDAETAARDAVHHPDQGRDDGGVDMDHIGVLRPQHLSQLQRPRQSGTDETDRHTQCLDLGHQMGFRLDEPQHPVVDGRMVTGPQLIQDQPFRPARTEPLDHMNDADSAVGTAARTLRGGPGETTHSKCPGRLTMQAIRPT